MIDYKVISNLFFISFLGFRRIIQRYGLKNICKKRTNRLIIIDKL